nr:hypothetical protein [Mobiluncus mulieris]
MQVRYNVGALNPEILTGINKIYRPFNANQLPALASRGDSITVVIEALLTSTIT